MLFRSDMIKNLNKIASDGVEPDLTFYLKINPEQAFKRKMKNELDAIELSGLDFHKKVADGFDQIAKEEKHRYVVVDATQDTATIQKKVREIFLERYNERLKK